MATFPVGSNSKPSKVAGAIDSFIRNGEEVRLSYIGAGAALVVGVTLAIAKGYLAKSNKGILERPRFENVEVKGERRTTIVIALDVYDLN